MSFSSIMVTVDDTDPRIHYFGPWERHGVAAEHNNTTHGTSEVGSQAHFRFIGNYVAVYGTIANKSTSLTPKSRYVIDDFTSGIFYPPVPDQVLYKQLFYKSPRLSTNLSEHVLIITTLDYQSTFWLDFFEIGVDLPSETEPSVSPQPSTTRASVGSQSSMVAPPVDSQPSRPLISAGTIAGAGIGSVLIVILIGIAIWLYFRKKRLSKNVKRWEPTFSP